MVTTDSAAPGGRKRLGKSVWIRLAIYVPLLSFFGWRAADRALDEREAADAAFRTDLGVWLESPPGIIDLENAIPVQGDAFMNAATDDETGTETGGTETGTTGTTSETSTDTGDTGTDTAGDTSTTTGTTSTGEPPPEPAPGEGTSTTTTGGP